MEEKELISLLKKSDNKAFKYLVEEYQGMVINTCYRFLYNREDAEDIAQDVFIEAFQSIKKFRGDSKVSTWIYRIAISKSLDQIRKKKRKKRFAILRDIGEMQEKGEEIAASVSTNPHFQLEKKEQEKILEMGLAALPENQRIAITLSKYEGLSNKEIMEIMDTSLSAVESMIHRAKRNLEKKLFSYFEKKQPK